MGTVCVFSKQCASCLPVANVFQQQNYIIFSTMVDESLAKKVAGLDAGEESNTLSDNASAEPIKIWFSHQFWEYIDDLLDEMHEEVRNEPNDGLRKQIWNK